MLSLAEGDMAQEILAAWFDTEPGTDGLSGVEAMRDIDARHRK